MTLCFHPGCLRTVWRGSTFLPTILTEIMWNVALLQTPQLQWTFLWMRSSYNTMLTWRKLLKLLFHLRFCYARSRYRRCPGHTFIATSTVTMKGFFSRSDTEDWWNWCISSENKRLISMFNTTIYFYILNQLSWLVIPRCTCRSSSPIAQLGDL